jgi:plastocyanin
MLNSKSTLVGGLTVAVLAVALILSGFGAAVALGGVGGGTPSTTTATTTVTNSSSNSPFVVTLVIATNSIYNVTAADQPAYFVLGPNGLQTSASISLPANRLIKLVIVNYDDGSANLTAPSYNVVSGTTDGSIFVASNDNINSSEGPSGIVVNGGQTLTTVPTDEIAHTFTVPSLNLNIPVPLSSTVVAYFTVDKAGSYLWFCETGCGDFAMSTPGWMTGSLVAS